MVFYQKRRIMHLALFAIAVLNSHRPIPDSAGDLAVFGP